jgi:hypothetical protein
MDKKVRDRDGEVSRAHVGGATRRRPKRRNGKSNGNLARAMRQKTELEIILRVEAAGEARSRRAQPKSKAGGRLAVEAIYRTRQSEEDAGAS